jgi:hypothetical protein
MEKIISTRRAVLGSIAGAALVPALPAIALPMAGGSENADLFTLLEDYAAAVAALNRYGEDDPDDFDPDDFEHLSNASSAAYRRVEQFVPTTLLGALVKLEIGGTESLSNLADNAREDLWRLCELQSPEDAERAWALVEPAT